VFGGDSHRAHQVAMQIEAGHVPVNGATVQNEAQAWQWNGKNPRGKPVRDGLCVWVLCVFVIGVTFRWREV
jgi:hypothetical protein